MMRPGIEPRSPRPLANTLPTRPMGIFEDSDVGASIDSSEAVLLKPLKEVNINTIIICIQDTLSFEIFQQET